MSETSMKSRLNNVFDRLGGALVGAVLGLIGGLIGRFTAQAAVNVRPRLATVGFLDAALTNHGHDWLFYHYPNAMLAFSVGFASMVGLFFWRSL